jgi:hypothetical protein
MTPKEPDWRIPVLPSEYRDASGIVRIALAGGPKPIRLPKDIALPRPVLAITDPPAFVDQVYVYATASELLRVILDHELGRLIDVEPFTMEDVVDAIRDVPFEPAMRFLASLQKALSFVVLDGPAQVHLMREIFGPIYAAAGEIWLREEPRRALFSEQQLFALQRLAVLHARDDDADDLTQEEQVRIRLALLWTPDAVLGAPLGPDLEIHEEEETDLTDERWLRFFVGTGGLVSHASLRHELPRAHRMYAVIARSSAARRHRDFCPLDEWLQYRFGLTFEELQGLGLALDAGSQTLNRSVAPVIVTPSYFDSTALAGRVVRSFEAIAASREWFRKQFEGSAEHPRRAAFEIQPFLRRPGLLQSDGNIAVLAPRAIEGWMSATGAYYRFLDLARDCGQFDKFTRFNGWIQERYARHLAYVAHPDQRRRGLIAGTGCVYDDLPYRTKQGESRTSDVAIDLGLDLVLIEVTSKRLTLKSVVDADTESVLKDVRALLTKKMRQLGVVIRDLAASRVVIGDVEMSHVKRIWPMIVVADGLFQNPSLWAWTHREGGHHLEFDVSDVPQLVQPLVILDLEEYEALMSLVRRSGTLINILGRKTSPLWRERDFKSWLVENGHQAGVKDDFIAQELHRAFVSMVAALGLRGVRRPPSASADLAA